MRNLAICLFAALAAASQPARAGEERRNWFDDPFGQATRGMPACPAPLGPLMTEAERLKESHTRAERGTSCWLQKKCEQPNAYLYDRGIHDAVVKAIAADRRFAGTSVWVTTQRRFVYLHGCVRDRAQIAALMALATRVPDVERVLDELQVGTGTKTPYRKANGKAKAP
jgi:BON domain